MTGKDSSLFTIQSEDEDYFRMQITNLKSIKGNFEDFAGKSSRKPPSTKRKKGKLRQSKFNSVDRGDLSKISSLISNGEENQKISNNDLKIKINN